MSNAPSKCPTCRGSGWIEAPKLLDGPALNLSTGEEAPGAWVPGGRDPCPDCYGTGVIGLGRDQPDAMMLNDEDMNDWGALSQEYNVDPSKLPPLGPPRQGKLAHPLYKRFVFSPASGEVELSDNSGDPLDVRYHSDLAQELNEPGLIHGYAYRLADGWRLTDTEHKPLSDPFVIAQVMRALNNEPSQSEWADDDPDWSRTHLGIPS